LAIRRETERDREQKKTGYLETFPGHGIPTASVGDDECEDGEDEEESDEQEHDDQVRHQERFKVVAPGTQHAHQRHHQYEPPDDDNRPFQEMVAHRIVLLCKPDAHCDDRQRKH